MKNGIDLEALKTENNELYRYIISLQKKEDALKKALEAKDQIIKRKDRVFEEMLTRLSATIKRLEARIQANQKDEDIESLKTQLSYYKELYVSKVKEMFCRSSEQSDSKVEVLDDIELTQHVGEIEEKVADILDKPEEKKKVQKRRNLVNVENTNLPVIEEHLTIDAPDLKEIGVDIVNRICVVPAKYFIKKYFIHKYKNKKTGEIIKAGEERGALGKSMIDEAVLSEIINEKVLNSSPLYRQENKFELLGIDFSRQCMSNLIFKTYPALKPLLDEINSYIKSADINRSDETGLNVIEMRKDKPTSSKFNSYIWLLSTGNGYEKAYSYNLGPGRNKEVILNYFGDERKRYLISDGYNAYKGINNITNVYCLAHMRRNFFKLINSNSTKDSKAVKIVSLFDSIYHEEKLIKEKNLSYEEIKEERIKHELPIVEVLTSYITSLKETVSKQSSIYKAINYYLEHIEGFMKVFEDGRLELDNNASERGIKDLVIGRKNWLFANTSKGAEVTLLYYSLIKTAKENNLNTYDYITKLLRELPYKYDPSFDYKKYLPWNLKSEV